jgi:hypothetical protein
LIGEVEEGRVDGVDDGLCREEEENGALEQVPKADLQPVPQ